jgi:cell wall-associated NlpC family hydrolase
LLRRILTCATLFASTLLAPAAFETSEADAAINVSPTREHSIRLKVTRYAEIQAAQRAPYCRGGTGPVCFDCSGLVYASYRWAGLTLPVRTSTQMRGWTKGVSLRYARTGDLLFYSGHVEMVYRKNGIGPKLAVSANTFGRPASIHPIRTQGLLKVGQAVY